MDDKLVDDLIMDIDKLGLSGNNTFYIRGDKNHPMHVKNKVVNWVNTEGEILNVFKKITVQDKLIIHWYDTYIGKLCLKLKPEIQLYVVPWGGDVYEEPYLYHINWVHDKLTLKYVKAKYLYPRKWSKRPWVYLDQLKYIKALKKQTTHEFELKKQTINRINYILINPPNIGEVKLIKKIYNVISLPSFPFNYNQNFDLANAVRKKAFANNTELTLLIGNSGTESNNHYDCFKTIKKLKKKNISIKVPLAYGSDDYIQFVKFKALGMFKEKFEPLENFIAREEYISKLNEVDIGIMYHNRSQAFGNMITLLSLGKKLYIKSNNPLWQLFQKVGIKVFDANTIGNLTFEEFSLPITNLEIQSNIEKISALFSEKKRLEYLSKVLN